MKKYICTICGYIYDEAAGSPESDIAPGTKWEDIPVDWECPLCGASKDEFEEQKEAILPTEKELVAIDNNVDEDRELSFSELSALCSNLSKGCEKQYRNEEAELFGQLSAYYKNVDSTASENQFEDLSKLIEKDLSTGYSNASKVAVDASDRGSQRALLWGEKVTKILNSLLNKYKKQKDKLLENTNVYVCEICGFIYIGDKSPDNCPVCKVPNTKIALIKGGY